MSFRPWWVRVLAIAGLAFVVIAGVPAVREPILRSVGRTLVVEDSVASADVIVVSLDSGGAGVLEASDLVKNGVARRVAVFSDPPTGADREFIRRGLPYEDMAARQIRQLEWLGVTDVERIPALDAGTESEGRALSAWSRERQFRSLVVVSTTDHTRRLRRVIRRYMDGLATTVAIRASRYSSFDPDRWWQSRGGIRTQVIELQKLLLDVALHPLSP